MEAFHRIECTVLELEMMPLQVLQLPNMVETSSDSRTVNELAEGHCLGHFGKCRRLLVDDSEVPRWVSMTQAQVAQLELEFRVVKTSIYWQKAVWLRCGAV
ncbi:unnamed protein product [Anisakis simplex]|uniref:Uncharacterized protein n=1 Tax=Anisakis simplex TaxID=6269 RepID=A0A0M3J6J7_ANISI|nr:unnamed protein product [Anisakis simplex]